MPKHSTHLLFTLLFLAATATGQHSEYTVEKLKLFPLQPDSIVFNKPLPFASVQVIDARADTSKVGFGMRWGHFQKLVVEGGVANRVQTLLQNTLHANADSAAPSSLLIVIRQLWLHEPSYKEQLQKNSALAAHEQPSLYSECRAKLEVYRQQQDAYTPLFRLDSTFSFDHSLKNKGGTNVSAPFVVCLEKLSRLNYSKAAASGQRLSLSQIEAYNKKHLAHPILSTEAKQRGLYLTFADFLNNRITPWEFEVEFEHRTDQLYLIENGQKRLFQDFWGFCDGDRIFVRNGFNYYHLVKQAGTFEFIGKPRANQSSQLLDIHADRPVRDKTMASRSTRNAMIRMAGPNLNDGGYKPYQLDLETGNFY